MLAKVCSAAASGIETYPVEVEVNTELDNESASETDEPTMELLRYAMTDQKLSARAYDRLLKCPALSPDLAGSEEITFEHVSEGIQFQSLDRRSWT